ncbi:MAG TPA: enoyl-CoA hydratase [Afifellaceae bacterium]|nr:enoyl-CoA hydratase [Afifellaceae bacterium]
MDLRYFEDFTVGQRLALAPFHVTAGEIAAFAAEFGSLPVEFDVAAGAPPAASGWHGCAIFMAMICRGWLSETEFLGAPGVDKVRWLRPIRAGDRLGGVSQVMALRASKSRPELGFVHVRHSVANAAGDSVLSLENPMIFARRPLAAPS